MTDFRCDENYLIQVFSDLHITEQYNQPSPRGLVDLSMAINKLSPGKQLHEHRRQIQSEFQRLTSAADCIIEILDRVLQREKDNEERDFRYYALQEMQLDPQNTSEIMTRLKEAFKKVEEQTEIITPTFSLDAKAKAWHGYVVTHATAYIRCMATTNIAFAPGKHNASKMCQFLARVIEDRFDGPVEPFTVRRFLERSSTGPI